MYYGQTVVLEGQLFIIKTFVGGGKNMDDAGRDDDAFKLDFGGFGSNN